MKVLVTGAGALLGQGIIRSLRRSAMDVRIVAADPSPLSAGLYWADAAHLVPLATAPEYGAAIERILTRERPDAVLIGTDVELAFFARERERLEQTFETRVVVSPPHAVEIADDKWLTAEFLREHAFGYAESALPGGEDALLERVGFPLVVKPRRGARSVGLSVVHTRAELTRAMNSADAPVVQRYVGSADDEYTAGVLCFDGAAAASIVMRRDLRDGNTYRAYVDAFETLHHDVRRIAEALRADGPVNIQFRVEGARVIPFEINARFSGTTPLRALAGFNEVEMVLARLAGRPFVAPVIRPMTILRHWSETIVDDERLRALTGGR